MNKELVRKEDIAEELALYFIEHFGWDEITACNEAENFTESLISDNQ